MKARRSVHITGATITALICFAVMSCDVGAWPIPDTGQAKCYNNTAEIPCPAPGEAFYGQDGNYTINPPSYTKLGASGEVLPDGAASWAMVKDNVTGLIWENKTNDASIHDGSKTFSWCDRNPATNGGNQGTCGTGAGNAATDTEAFIKTLNDVRYGGYSDWRLPTAKELMVIVDRSRVSPATNAVWFPNTESSNYWSAPITGNGRANGVEFGYGGIFQYNYVIDLINYGKTNTYAVRAVRGGQSENGYIDNGDGTATDKTIGLMWQKETISTRNWQEALYYAESLTLAGYDDWRLPSAGELHFIVDGQYHPAYDPTVPPGIASSYYWSSTTHAGGGGSGGGLAWCVSFVGDSCGRSKSDAYVALAVRGGQSRSLSSLVIDSPAQAAYWKIGDQKTITWDTAGIAGNVKITLSRQGGKTGTFTEVITQSISNSGAYDWTVTGPDSVNCALRIEPLSDPTKGTTQSLFRIYESFTIAATGGTNGTISPTGTLPVEKGSSQNFALTPNAGFNVSDVTVDGNSVGPVKSYAFDNIAANHTINASFVADTPTTGSISINGGDKVTNQRNVQLTFNIADADKISAYYLSESPTPPPPSSTWTSITAAPNYSADIAYTLSAGDGGKIVHVWLKDTAGNISSAFTASITLDLSAAFPLDVWTWAAPSTSTQNFNAIAYGNGLRVAVGDNGTISTSADGITWTPKTYGSINANLYGVTYGNGLFVAVGSNGVILTSSNGSTWHARNSGTTNQLNAIAFGNSKFVAVSSNWWDKVLTSEDGTTWEQKSLGTYLGAYSSLYGITFGNGRFMAVGSGNGDTMTSTDGVVWTYKSAGSYLNLRGVAYGNGKFVAVGGMMPTASITTSSDGGATWENKTPSGLTNSLNGVSYANNTFVAVGDGGKILTSPDGLTWTSKTSGTSNLVKSVTHDGTLFIAVGGSGTMSTSADGNVWMNRTISLSSMPTMINAIAYGNGTFVGVGGEGKAITSPDGLTWTSRQTGSTQSISSIAYGNGIFVASGCWSPTMISGDGVTWNKLLTVPPPADRCFAALTYGSGKFVGSSMNNIYTSTDGLNWVNRTSGTSYPISSFAYGNGKFVALGSSAPPSASLLILTSPDGITWTKQSVDITAYLNSVAFGNGKFVAVGSNGAVFLSTDGVSWTEGNSGTTNSLNSVTFGNGMFVAINSMAMNGTIIVSADGVTWKSKTLGIQFNKMTYGNGTFVGIGSSPTAASLLQSRMPLAPPSDFTVSLDGSAVNLRWAANKEPGLKGYKVYWDTDGDHPYANVIDVGNVTSYSTAAIPDGAYVTVTAYDGGYAVGKDDPTTLVNENQTNGSESWFAEGYLIEKAAPTNPSVIINSGSAYTNDPSVTLHLGAQDTGGIAAYYVAETATAPARDGVGWVAVGRSTNLALDYPFALSTGDGAKTVYVWFKDGVGNISQATSATITLDSAGTTGSVSINGGSAKTAKREVTLSLSASDSNGIGAYYISESGTPPTQASTWASVTSTKAYSANVAYTLSAGDGSKTVYAWFKDVAGNTSAPVSASINLDISLAAPLEVWTWAMPSTSTQTFNAIASGNGLRVAVGDNGTISTSTDGATWVTKTYGNINANLYGITYGNGLFVAVGSSGFILTSPDGVVWHGRNSGTTNELRGIAFGGGRFAAVSSMGYEVYTSTDGSTWEKKPTGNGGMAGPLLRNISYGNDRFLSINDNVLYTSADGTTWESKSTGTSVYQQGIIYAGGKYVAMGGMTAGIILISIDAGTTWEDKTPTGLTNTLNGVSWGNNTFVVVGDGGKILTSGDGLTWTSRPSGTTNSLRAVVHDGTQIIAVGGSGTIITSPDGNTWTNRATSLPSAVNAIAYGNETFVAVGYDGKAYTSLDGLAWTNQTTGLTQSLSSIAYGNGMFVAAGCWSPTMTSRDGVTWNKLATGPPAPASYCLNAVTYGSGKFVGLSGSNIYKSTDGLNWTSQTLESSNSLNAIAYGNDMFVAVGNMKTALSLGPFVTTSHDGITWTNQSVTSSVSGSGIVSVAFGNGRFVAVGGNGTVLTSTDGINWSQENSGTSEYLNSVTFGNGIFVSSASMGGNKINISKDGVTWKSRASGMTFSRMSYGNGVFVGIGGIAGSASLLQSRMPIAPPTNAKKVFSGESIAVSWQANKETQVAGYKIYYGPETEPPYAHVIDVGKVPSYTLTGVTKETNIAVTAYGTDAKGADDIFEGHESWYAPAQLLTRIYIEASPVPLSNYSKHQLRLIGEYEGGRYDLGGSWTSSDATVATVSGSILAAVKSGWVEVSTTYEGVTYRNTFLVYTTTANTEGNSVTNNDKTGAKLITSGEFYKGTLPEGDSDWFKFNITASSLIDLAYLSEAGATLSVYDNAGGVSGDTLMAAGTSANGQSLNLSLGLAPGTYYVKLVPTTADPSKSYVVTYKAVGDAPAKVPLSLAINETKASTLNNLTDVSEFNFTLYTRGAVRLLFTPQSRTADYHLALLNEKGEILNRIDILNQVPGSLEGNYPAGIYTLRVTPATDVDAANPFTVQLLENSAQLEMEPNNAGTEATPMDITKPMTGQLSRADDLDFYDFTLAAPRYLALTVTAPQGTGTYRIALYKDSVENEIDSFTAIGNQSTTVHMGLSVGRYYLKVGPEGGIADTTHYYTLAFASSDQTNLEIESNNTLKFANAIDGVNPKKGRIYSVKDIDTYGFHVSSTDDVRILFKPSSANTGYNICIVDETFVDDVETPCETIQVKNGTDLDYTYYPWTAGNYYIRVWGIAGNIDPFKSYELSINSTAEITPLKQKVSVTVNGSAKDMTVGGTQSLTALMAWSDATTEQVTPLWASLDESVASVDASGAVTARTAGTTSIVATYGGFNSRFDITVGSPQNVVKQHYGNLILVGGGGYTQTNTIKEATLYLSDLVYRRFKDRLFTDDDIYFFHPWPSHDLNGDGYPENIVRDTSPTAAKLGTAITQWAASQSTDGPLYLYLIDHGGLDYFTLFEDQNQQKENLTAAQLKGYIDAFQAATNRRVIVIIEACKSGSFTNDLVSAGQDRIVVTSTNDQYQLLSSLGTDSFTQFFMDKLWEGNSIYSAFTRARQKLIMMGSPYNQQVPQLAEGLSLASSTIKIGGDFAIAGAIPEFTGQSLNANISVNTSQELFARFDAAVIQEIEKVWAVVVPPVYQSSGTEIQTIQFPTVDLTDTERKGRYAGTYSTFSYNGEYRIVYYARTTNGILIVSSPTSLTVSGGIDTPKTLTVTKTGPGSGTVTSNPAGINCGADCTETYAAATSVTLSASATSGSMFAGWSGGGCSGSGSCTLSVNATLQVTAEFAKDNRGDLNGDGSITLADAILAMQVMTKTAPAQGTTGGVRTGYASSGADVNGDNNIGIAEVIYILQKVAEVR